MDFDELENRFRHHEPTGTQPERCVTIRDTGKRLASVIVQVTPESREQSLALTKLEECIMWANAAIARNE